VQGRDAAALRRACRGRGCLRPQLRRNRVRRLPPNTNPPPPPPPPHSTHPPRPPRHAPALRPLADIRATWQRRRRPSPRAALDAFLDAALGHLAAAGGAGLLDCPWDATLPAGGGAAGRVALASNLRNAGGVAPNALLQALRLALWLPHGRLYVRVNRGCSGPDSTQQPISLLLLRARLPWRQRWCLPATQSPPACASGIAAELTANAPKHPPPKVYEDGSADATRHWLGLLQLLLAPLGVPARITLNGTGLGRGPGEGRIPHLARLRNALVDPFYPETPGALQAAQCGAHAAASEEPPPAAASADVPAPPLVPTALPAACFRPDAFLFINDVFWCASDAARLLLHGADVDLACGLDVTGGNRRRRRRRRRRLLADAGEAGGGSSGSEADEAGARPGSSRQAGQRAVEQPGRQRRRKRRRRRQAQPPQPRPEVQQAQQLQPKPQPEPQPKPQPKPQAQPFSKFWFYGEGSLPSDWAG
jgi:hypothetical protein